MIKACPAGSVVPAYHYEDIVGELHSAAWAPDADGRSLGCVLADPWAQLAHSWSAFAAAPGQRKGDRAAEAWDLHAIAAASAPPTQRV